MDNGVIDTLQSVRSSKHVYPSFLIAICKTILFKCCSFIEGDPRIKMDHCNVDILRKMINSSLNFLYLTRRVTYMNMHYILDCTLQTEYNGSLAIFQGRTSCFLNQTIIKPVVCKNKSSS